MVSSNIICQIREKKTYEREREPEKIKKIYKDAYDIVEHNLQRERERERELVV